MDGDDGEMVIGFCVKKSKKAEADTSPGTDKANQSITFTFTFPYVS